MGCAGSRDNKSKCWWGTTHGKLIKAFWDIGVSFSVWASRKVGKDLDFTSLMGPNKPKMMARLPGKFSEFRRPDTCPEVKWLWEEFYSLYLFISAWKPAPEDIKGYQKRVKEWVTRFCALGDRRLGYQKSNVTPSVHDFAMHVHNALENLDEGSLKPYSCTPIKKKNDFARMITLRHSNNHNAAHDVILACEREAYLEPFERETRHHSDRRSAADKDAEQAETEPEPGANGYNHLKPALPKPSIPPATQRDPAALAARAAAQAAAAQAAAAKAFSDHQPQSAQLQHRFPTHRLQRLQQSRQRNPQQCQLQEQQLLKHLQWHHPPPAQQYRNVSLQPRETAHQRRRNRRHELHTSIRQSDRHT